MGREGEREREREPASWAVALGAKVTRPPSALSPPLRSPRRTMDNIHLFYHTSHLQPLRSMKRRSTDFLSPSSSSSCAFDSIDFTVLSLGEIYCDREKNVLSSRNIYLSRKRGQSVYRGTG